MIVVDVSVLHDDGRLIACSETLVDTLEAARSQLAFNANEVDKALMRMMRNETEEE